MNSSMPWVKMYVEMLDDIKLEGLADDLKWRFVQLILLAGEFDAEGYLPYSTRKIAWRLRMDEQTLLNNLHLLNQAELMFYDEEKGFWCVTNFSKRQGRSQAEKRDEWRERQQRHREKENNVTHESPMTPALVTLTEKEEEKESSGVAGEDDRLPEKPPQKVSELEPSTPGGRKLFARLQANAKAKGRRGPRQFETPEQRDKFLTAEKRLPPDELERAITAGLEAGAFERARIIAWVAKWVSGNGRYHPPDDPGLPQKIICDASRGYNQ